MARGVGGEGGAAGGRDPMGGVGSRGFSGFGGGNGGGFGAMGSPSAKNYKPLPVPPMVKPKAPAPGPNLMRSFVPAAMLGQQIPGLQDYMLNLPSYGYFGQPGQMRPQSMIMGGI
jgi:hypothetical protein